MKLYTLLTILLFLSSCATNSTLERVEGQWCHSYNNDFLERKEAQGVKVPKDKYSHLKMGFKDGVFSYENDLIVSTKNKNNKYTYSRRKDTGKGTYSLKNGNLRIVEPNEKPNTVRIQFLKNKMKLFYTGENKSDETEFVYKRCKF